MTDKKTGKPTLNLTGPSKGAPSLDDLRALFVALTGKEPTEEDMAEAKAMYELHVEKTKI